MPGRTVDAYIKGLTGWRREAVRAIVEIIETAAPKASGSIKWSQPVFDQAGPFCYVRAFPRHVNFGFWRGTELSDRRGLLAGTGGKMRHVRVSGIDDIDARGFGALVREAVRLNAKHGDPTKARAAKKKPAKKKLAKKKPAKKKLAKKKPAKKKPAAKKKPSRKVTKKRVTKARRRSR